MAQKPNLLYVQSTGELFDARRRRILGPIPQRPAPVDDDHFDFTWWK
jgi:hypothetical protein